MSVKFSAFHPVATNDGVVGTAMPATRIEDGLNMIPAALSLSTALPSNGAITPAPNLAATGRLAFRYLVGVGISANSKVIWTGAPYDVIPVTPGERLFYRHAVFAEVSSTDYCYGGLTFYGSDGTLISTLEVPNTRIAANITTGFFTDVSGSLLVPTNSAYVQPFVLRPISTGGGMMYIGEPHLGRQASGATRNDDTANMIPSPVVLDQIVLAAGADTDFNPAATGRPANAYRVRLRNQALSTVFWNRSTTGIPCAPGEKLYYSHVIYADTANTEYTEGMIEWYDISGTYISISSIAGTGHTGNITNNVWTTKVGSAIVPANASFARPLARRTAAGAGIHYVSEPYLGRAQPGADITVQIIGTALLLPKATSAGVLDGVSPYASAQYQLLESGVPLTGGITWSTDSPVGITKTITGAGTATLNITGMTVDSVILTLTAARAGKPSSTFKVTITKDKAPPPTSGSGGGSGGGTGTAASQSSGFITYNTGTAAIVSNELAITVGTGGIVTLSVSLNNHPAGGINGTWYDRFQWARYNGSTYVAIGTTFDATVATTSHTNSYTDAETGQVIPAEDFVEPGSISNSQNYTSSNGASENFKLLGYHLGTSTNTTRVTTLFGQISAQG